MPRSPMWSSRTNRAVLRAVADEIVEINRLIPAATSKARPMTNSPSGGGVLEAQARRQESVANQVRRETEWRAARNPLSGASPPPGSRTRPDGRAELAELKYRNRQQAERRGD